MSHVSILLLSLEHSVDLMLNFSKLWATQSAGGGMEQEQPLFTGGGDVKYGTKVLQVSGASLEEPRWTLLDNQTPWLMFKPAENF